MHGTYTSNLVLWGVQGFLALFFSSASAPKLLGRGLERWTGFSALPRAQVVFIGATEVLGALGLVLPMASGIAPWLTPLAAIGLATIVLMAAGFHLRANEYLEAVEGIKQVGYRDWITVRAPNSAEAEFFKLPSDGRVAMFEIFRTAFDGNQAPMRLTKTVFPADRNQFIVNNGQVPDPATDTEPGYRDNSRE